MTTDPNNGGYSEQELNEQQLDNVAGGKRVPYPRAGKKDLQATQLSDDQLEGVSGGNLGPSPTELPEAPRHSKKPGDLDATKI